MTQNNLLKAGKRLATAAKEQVVSTAQQKVAGVKKKLGTVGSSPGRLTRAATYEVNRAALRLEGKSSGPNTRGGKRKPAQSAKPSAAPAVDVNKKAPNKAKATPTMTRGSMKRSAIPKAETTVRDIVTENKMSATASSGISKKARTIQIGGLIGRTGGKWHLGKKVGKG